LEVLIMFQKSSTLSILSGLLLAAACAGSAVAETRDGGVELVTSAATDAGDVANAAPAKLTITGLDRAFRTQVQLERGRRAKVALPAGLYAVDAASSASSDEPVIPALSAPKLVVVAAGHVTTVNVSVDVDAPHGAALAALEH
jgi:hypothetical protein